MNKILLKHTKIPLKRGDINLRVDKALQQHYNIAWNDTHKLFKKKLAFIYRDDKKIFSFNEKIQSRDLVCVLSTVNSKLMEETLPESELDPSLVEPLIGNTNKSFFVLNKPSNLPSQGGHRIEVSLDKMLLAKDSESRLVHRLDKPVSGVMVAARSRRAAQEYQDAMKKGKFTKIYVAVGSRLPTYLGQLSQNSSLISPRNMLSALGGSIFSDSDCAESTIELNNGWFQNFDHKGFRLEKRPTKLNRSMMGKYYISHFFLSKGGSYKVLDVAAFQDQSKSSRESIVDLLLSAEKVNPVFIYQLNTGKKHQIRKHLSKVLFSPILNDNKYSEQKEGELFLHSYQLTLPSSEWFSFNSLGTERNGIFMFKDKNTITAKATLPNNFKEAFTRCNYPEYEAYFHRNDKFVLN